MANENQKIQIPSTWTSYRDKNLNEAVQHLFEERVLNQTEISLNQTEISLIRDYLTDYINAPCWLGGEALSDLRDRVTTLSSTQEIRDWVQFAVSIGIDPF